MGAPDDFTWSYTDEPHLTRRQVILMKHPEIRELYGPDRGELYAALAVIVIQLGMGWLVRDCSWGWLFFWAYWVGGTFNHTLSLAVHELSHFMMHPTKWVNVAMGMVCNLPQGLPTSVMFRKYHIEHHQFQGVEDVDVDIPSRLEGKIFSGFFMKIVFVVLQPFTYSLRPFVLRPKLPCIPTLINLVVALTFDYYVYKFVGIKPLVYFVSGTFLGMTFHPMAGHLLAEHYTFKPDQETYSYYGPMNKLAFNVGYHNEHHDFPQVPGSRLPEVRRLAPEFYDTLPHYNSWFFVLLDFVKRADLSAFSRVMRKSNTNAIIHRTGMPQ
jgi:sphingolipid delta-4 desaturase